MSDAIIFLYELLHGQMADPTFRLEIYVPTGIWLVLLTFLICAAFYFLFNHYSSRWNSIWHYIGFLAANVVVNMFVAYWMCFTSLEFLEPFWDVFYLSLINGAYAAVLFFVLSLILKPFSVNGSAVPF